MPVESGTCDLWKCELSGGQAARRGWQWLLTLTISYSAISFIFAGIILCKLPVLPKNRPLAVDIDNISMYTQVVLVAEALQRHCWSRCWRWCRWWFSYRVVFRRRRLNLLHNLLHIFSMLAEQQDGGNNLKLCQIVCAFHEWLCLFPNTHNNHAGFYQLRIHIPGPPSTTHLQIYHSCKSLPHLSIGRAVLLIHRLLVFLSCSFLSSYTAAAVELSVSYSQRQRRRRRWSKWPLIRTWQCIAHRPPGTMSAHIPERNDDSLVVVPTTDIGRVGSRK